PLETGVQGNLIGGSEQRAAGKYLTGFQDGQDAQDAQDSHGAVPTAVAVVQQTHRRWVVRLPTILSILSILSILFILSILEMLSVTRRGRQPKSMKSHGRQLERTMQHHRIVRSSRSS